MCWGSWGFVTDLVLEALILFFVGSSEILGVVAWVESPCLSVNGGITTLGAGSMGGYTISTTGAVMWRRLRCYAARLMRRWSVSEPHE